MTRHMVIPINFTKHFLVALLWCASISYARQPGAHQPSPQESTPFANVSYDDLKVIKDKAVANGNISGAISCLERLIKICNNLDELGNLMIELADLLLAEGSFAKATMVYEKFASLYPGSAKAEYALYQAIVARFNIVLSPDRDQTKTEEVIALADKFIGRETFARYKQEVQSIRKRCYEQLLDTESRICTFYAKKGNMAAVHRRLTYMQNNIIAKEPSLEPYLMGYQVELAEICNDIPLAHQKRAELHEKFPEQELIIAKNAEFSWSWLKIWA